MKLTSLDPQWILRDGLRIGFTFVSPVQHAQGTTKWRLSCFIVKVSADEQFAIFDDKPVCHCKPGTVWTIVGGTQSASFDTLTVHPSIDASPGGLWHGYVRNGEMI